MTTSKLCKYECESCLHKYMITAGMNADKKCPRCGSLWTKWLNFPEFELKYDRDGKRLGE